MYEPLEAALDKVKLSDLGILDRVDEYTLYCHYLGFEPLLSTGYRSVIRMEGSKADSNPSFSIYSSNKKDREYMWKDAGLGESGDIFKLIKLLLGYVNNREVYQRISNDFNLGYFTPEVSTPKIVKHARPTNPPETDIRICSKPFTKQDLAYWASFGVSPELLQAYKVKSIKYYWLFKHQVDPIVPQGLAFSYEVLGKYKIYQPFAPRMYKFRNNYTIQCLEGFAQLQYNSDTLIITKATKDVLTLRALGYEAVAPRGENILVPDQFMNHLSKMYSRIVILFDNDMKHKGDEYNHPKIYVPLSSRTKDISDFRKAYGHKSTVELMERLINSL